VFGHVYLLQAEALTAGTQVMAQCGPMVGTQGFNAFDGLLVGLGVRRGYWQFSHSGSPAFGASITSFDFRVNANTNKCLIFMPI
jgi:hypothetical protein